MLGEKHCLRKCEACSGSTGDSKVICQCPLLCYVIVHQIKNWLVVQKKKKKRKKEKKPKIKQIPLSLATCSTVSTSLTHKTMTHIQINLLRG